MLRIQKFLANQGILSRREADAAIRDKRVKINDELAALGQVLEPGDIVSVDGRVIVHKLIKSQVFLYNKPLGKICSLNPDKNYRSIWEDFPDINSGKWISIGRLDVNSSGLLLVTSDGDLANKMMHPSSNLERVYRVRAMGRCDKEIIDKMIKGVMLDDGKANFKKAKVINIKKEGLNQWYEVTVTSGRYRMVRRIFEAVGLQVNRLIRVRFGPLILPKELKPGKVMMLDEIDINILKQKFRQ